MSTFRWKELPCEEYIIGRVLGLCQAHIRQAHIRQTHICEARIRFLVNTSSIGQRTSDNGEGQGEKQVYLLEDI
jgi:hypothetical protein